MESVTLTTADGVELDADIESPTSTAQPVGGVVVCHPHPQFGGDRFNPVVDAVFRRLPRLGFTTLRFDFRSAFGGGVDERLDVVAALDELERRGVRPLSLAGYSFGAAVALGTDDARVVALAAIAPPLGMMETAVPVVPTLVLTPQHDQFAAPEVVGPIVDSWPGTRFEIIESVDHFLLGRAAAVAESVGDWLVDRAHAAR